jgi:hypothetical protein
MRWLRDSALLLTASVSVALYYNIAFFGKALVALPSVPVAGGCLFYYLCAFNTTPPLAQVLLWMLSFLLSGWLWWAALARTLPQGGPPPRRGATLLLYALPLPWLLYIHALSPRGLSGLALRDAILVRDGLHWNSAGSEVWLNALYLILAMAESVATLWLLKRDSGESWSYMVKRAGFAALACLTALCLAANLVLRQA